MNYLWTTIHVANLEESIHFYEEFVNLTVIQRFQTAPGVEIAFLGYGEKNETMVELLSDQNGVVKSGCDFISLGFQTESYEAIMQKVEEKTIPLVGKPMKTPKYKWFTIKDPNGVSVSIFEVL